MAQPEARQIVDVKMLELMRCLTAAQAALWDVIDAPEAAGAQMMLGVMTTRVARLGAELITRRKH